MGPLVYKVSGLPTTQQRLYKQSQYESIRWDSWFTRSVVYPQHNRGSKNSLSMKVLDGTPGLQGEWFIHNTTAALQTVSVWKY